MFFHNQNSLNIKSWIVLLLSMIIYGTSDGINDSRQNEPIIMDGFGESVKITITPNKPTVGDQIKISFYLEATYKNIPEYRVQFTLYKGAELVNGKLITTLPPLKKGESTITSILVKVISPHLAVFAGAIAHCPSNTSKNEWDFGLGGKMIDMLLFREGEDLSYEKYGNDPEIWPRIGPEYLYDVIEGARMPSIGHVTKEAEEIRSEIEGLKQRDSTLTDWDALELLHDAYYELIVRYGINNKEKSINILLEARKLMREEKLSKWEATDRIINRNINKQDR